MTEAGSLSSLHPSGRADGAGDRGAAVCARPGPDAQGSAGRRSDREPSLHHPEIRSGAQTVTIDVSVHGAGPGTDWISEARMGDRIDAIGPRGKITVRPDADWHLFVATRLGCQGQWR